MTEFKLGDVVRLKSGSPAMTIVEIIPEQESITYMTCRWFVLGETETIDVPSDALLYDSGMREPGQVIWTKCDP